jgi:hypothetical protein
MAVGISVGDIVNGVIGGVEADGIVILTLTVGVGGRTVRSTAAVNGAIGASITGEVTSVTPTEVRVNVTSVSS